MKTANLQHPHILGLFDSGEAEGLVFYVMPYVAAKEALAGNPPQPGPHSRRPLPAYP